MKTKIKIMRRKKLLPNQKQKENEQKSLTPALKLNQSDQCAVSDLESTGQRRAPSDRLIDRPSSRAYIHE